MKHTLALMTGLLLLAAGTLTAQAANITFGIGGNQFAIDFVEFGNAGNAADTTGNPNPAGAVAYDYSISKYEISQNMIDAANGLTPTILSRRATRRGIGGYAKENLQK
jgi:hypothetical protein